MSAHRHQATWRDITFNRRYVDDGVYKPDDTRNLVTAYIDDDYVLESVNPTAINVVDMREARQFLEGAEPNQAFEGSRLIELRGRIVTPDGRHDLLEDRTRALYAAFSPASCRLDFAQLDPPHVGPLDFKLDTATDALALMRFYARPALGRPIVFGRRSEGTVRPFLARLIAYDPKMYSQTLDSTALTLLGAPNSVNASGDQATDPKYVIVLSGAGHATFTLTNTTTGHAMVFNLSTLAAGTYTLNVARATFTKSDGTNVLSTRVSGFPVNMWLAAGNNVLTVTGNTNLTSVTVQRRSAWS